MAKHNFLSALLSLLAVTCVAQNLVPNPSLEDMFDCPESISEFAFPSEAAVSVNNWFRPTDATTDYFNSCPETGSSGAIVDVPGNFGGYQVAKTGEAYAGCICYFPFIEFDYREYLETKLTTSLVAGHPYFVSYYTNLADATWDMVAIDRMGAYFSVEAEERVGSLIALTDLVPQITSPFGIALNDTLDWMNVSGIFTASGGEEWMIIGNFTPWEELNCLPMGGDDEEGNGYYYFDDFCVLDMMTPSVTTSADTSICKDTEIIIGGGDGYSNYFWHDGTTEQNKAITETGVYWVASVDAATCICRVDTLNVVVAAEPLGINLGIDTVVCRNTPLVLNAFDEAFSSYEWNTGDYSASISAAYPGTYYVTGSSDCYIDSDTIVLSAPPIPLVVLPDDIILCDGQELPVGTAMDNMEYQWNTGEDVCCINITEPGNYTLTATNICYDSDSDDITVSYSGCTNCILAPTAFSPNGDGLNDQFEVHVNCLMKEYKLSIFNRWGQLVFSSVKPDKHWDGLINGTSAELGVYFFYIEATPVIEGLGKFAKKGDITLIR